MSEFEAEFHELFDEIAEAFDKSTRPPTLPYQIAPLQYAGLGSFVPEEKPIDVNIFEFLPTRPTMRVQRKRDLLTGEVLGYEDMPIATDDQSTKGPFVSVDKSQNAGRSGPTGGMTDAELEAALRALDTGIGLLSSPFDDETCTDAALEPLPELPDFKETVVQDPWEERPKETALTYFGTVDTWDTKNFNTEIKNPACTFPHPLDDFQMRAIRRLERREHVFVSAPTSAGKTAVAQYAISLCIAEKMRAIYTAPVKALSNQKYYDFSRQYPSVGILTGDVSLNRDAGVLIMTTEILRAMLYRGDDVLRDVGCVIFDECHYISDEERGVVWEESIMLMPDHINMVFLSATVPNDEQVATWIARTKRRTVYIERHEKRPVPLTHHLYVEGKFFNVYGADCVFHDEQYTKAQQRFNEQCVTRGGRGRGNGRFDDNKKPASWYVNVVKTLKQKDLLPALIFSFSKDHIAQLGRAAGNANLDLATEAEKTQIRAETRRIMARLDPLDRQLPQVREVVALVEQGVGIHHSGMLFILKECVEILFIKGLLKVLFCTSTFAMGINAPARSCVFTTLKKNNGKELAPLTPTEYIQMSGRAGRRGKDTVGNVIILCTGLPDKQYLKNIVSGKAERLHSQFHVRWNMVLNIERTEGMSMSSFVSSSLFADADASKVSDHNSRIEKLRQKLGDLPAIDCPQDIEDTYAFGHQVDALKDMTKELSGSFDVIPSLSPGNIVCLVTDETITAALLRHAHPDGKKFEFITESEKSRTLKLNVVKESVVGFYPKQIPHFEVVSPTDLQLELKKIRETTELRPLCGSNKQVANEIRQKAGDLVAQYEALSKSPCFTCHHMSHHLSESLKRVKIEKEIEETSRAIEQTSTKHDSQIKRYRDFLTSLGYIEDNVVTLKGQICTQLQSIADEVLATELLFRNTYETLEVEDICAICAALTTERKRRDKDEVDIPRHLEPIMEDVRKIAEELAEQMMEADIEDADDWVDRKVNPVMVGPMYKWSKGEPLANVISQAGGVVEGVFVTAALKVAGLLNRYSQAARDLGNRDLENKFNMGVAMCQRGIACLESLYLQ